MAPGLWIWRLRHPGWRPGQGWPPVVTCTCVESRGEKLVLDPLAPPPETTAVWERLDRPPPTALVVLKPAPSRSLEIALGFGGLLTP